MFKTLILNKIKKANRITDHLFKLNQKIIFTFDFISFDPIIYSEVIK